MTEPDSDAAYFAAIRPILEQPNVHPYGSDAYQLIVAAQEWALAKNYPLEAAL